MPDQAGTSRLMLGLEVLLLTSPDCKQIAGGLERVVAGSVTVAGSFELLTQVMISRLLL
jgi:hypothetical protein